MRLFKIILIFVFAFLANAVLAQDTAKQKIISRDLFNNNSVVIKDTAPVVKKNSVVATKKPDSIFLKSKHDPHKATIRSAIIPGWGQAYNHEYWKIPIVYGALAIPVATFIYNNNWYHRTKDAFTILVNNDTNNYSKIYYKLQPFINNPYALQDLQNYRNAFRKDRDYSVLYFFLAWGLNVVDATVFGNLKDFDVSDNIGMNVSPSYNPSTKTAGLALVFNFKTPEKKTINFGK